MSNVNTQSQYSNTPGTDATRPSIEPVKQQAQAVGEELSQLGRVSTELAKEELAAVRERGTQVVEAAKDQAVQLEDSLVQCVRKQPMKSLAYAAGAGILFGFLARR